MEESVIDEITYKPLKNMVSNPTYILYSTQACTFVFRDDFITVTCCDQDKKSVLSTNYELNHTRNPRMKMSYY